MKRGNKKTPAIFTRAFADRTGLCTNKNIAENFLIKAGFSELSEKLSAFTQYPPSEKVGWKASDKARFMSLMVVVTN